MTFTVGNTELANLLVQDQVAKHEHRKQILIQKCETVETAIEELKIELNKTISKIALDKYDDKYRKANAILVELELEDDISEYDMVCEAHFEHIFRPYHNTKWTVTKYEDQLTGFRWVQVSFSFKKTTDSFESEKFTAHFPNKRNSGGHHSSFSLDKESSEKINKMRLRINDKLDWEQEIKDIEEDLKDTTKIKDRLLAGLTQQTLKSNPELMDKARAAIAAAENGQLTLEYRNVEPN